jgi:lipoate-protein ligase B
LNPHDVPVYRVGRGGDVTFHGPGQLVGYPLIDLTRHGRDVHAYLRGLEAVLIETLAQFGLTAQRAKGLTGVWIEQQKIASIGVGVRRWVTCHGFALNVDPDLTYFSHIVPCGLAGVEITSMGEILARSIEMAVVKSLVATIFARYFGYKEIVWQRNFPTPDPVNVANQ